MRRVLLCCFVLLAATADAADTLSFWDKPRRGANCFNETPPDDAYFQALRAYGATWVRLSFSKWKSARRDADFLFGNLDDYRALVREDLATLRATLDRAHAAGLRVVLTPLELPGSRWRQSNGGEFDDRLWSDKRYWQQSAAFWRDLTGWEFRPPSDTDEFGVLQRPATQPVRFLLQRLADEQEAVSAHLDLAATDRDAETARHEQLGAQAVQRTPEWTVMRDPTGWIYCITDRDPETGMSRPR